MAAPGRVVGGVVWRSGGRGKPVRGLSEPSGERSFRGSWNQWQVMQSAGAPRVGPWVNEGTSALWQEMHDAAPSVMSGERTSEVAEEVRALEWQSRHPTERWALWSNLEFLNHRRGESGIPVGVVMASCNGTEAMTGVFGVAVAGAVAGAVVGRAIVRGKAIAGTSPVTWWQ